MNKLTTLTIIILFSFGFLSQIKGQSPENTQAKQIKNQVDSIFQKMVVFAENLDFDKISIGVDDTHGAGFITNGKYYADYSTLINEVKTNAKGIDRQDITVQEKKITVLSDTMVLLTASGISKAFITDGKEFTANFQWSFIYNLIENQWKVIYSHQSTSRL